MGIIQANTHDLINENLDGILNMLPSMYRAIHACISHCAWFLSNFNYFFNQRLFKFVCCIIDGFCYCLLYEEAQVANESSAQQQTVVGESSSQINLSDVVGLPELEKLLKQKTYTRYAWSDVRVA